MVEMLKQDILLDERCLEPLAQDVLIQKVAHLDTHFRGLVAVEGRDARLGGTKLRVTQALFLIGIHQDVAIHQYLRAAGDLEVRLRRFLGQHFAHFFQQRIDVQRHAGADQVFDA